mgnify:CR=1 FL=1
MNGVSKLLSTDGFIAVNKTLIRELGLHEAIMIGEMCSEYNYWEKCNKLEDDMFYSTRDNIEYNTGLSEHFQRKALKTLQEKEIITTKKRGLPAVNYYKINFDKLLTILSTSSSSREEQDIESVNLNNNKQTKIKEQKNNSKELLQNSSGFDFGKQKPKKDNLFTKCVSLIDAFVTAHDCDNSVRRKLIMYLNFRLSVTDKPLYVNMWKGMLNKLVELCDDTQAYESVIDQSIERGYLSFYPINSKSYYTNLADKPWEKEVRCDTYTEEELEELRELDRQREAQGLRTRF